MFPLKHPRIIAAPQHLAPFKSDINMPDCVDRRVHADRPLAKLRHFPPRGECSEPFPLVYHPTGLILLPDTKHMERVDLKGWTALGHVSAVLAIDTPFLERGPNVSENGLQKTAFFMLLALILYVSIMGGA